MREHKRRHQVKKLDFLNSWYSWTGLSAIYWTGVLAIITYFLPDGGSSGTGTYHRSSKEFANSVAIILVSAGGFGIGIQQTVIALSKGPL